MENEYHWVLQVGVIERLHCSSFFDAFLGFHDDLKERNMHVTYDVVDSVSRCRIRNSNGYESDNHHILKHTTHIDIPTDIYTR